MWELRALRTLGKSPSGPAPLWGLRPSRFSDRAFFWSLPKYLNKKWRQLSQLTFLGHGRQEVQSANQVFSASRIGQDYRCHILADGRPTTLANDVLVCEVQAHAARQRSSLTNSAIWGQESGRSLNIKTDRRTGAGFKTHYHIFNNPSYMRLPRLDLSHFQLSRDTADATNNSDTAILHLTQADDSPLSKFQT